LLLDKQYLYVASLVCASYSTQSKKFPTKDTHYGVLGVKDNASSNEIRGAFLKKVKECHPDINQADPLSEKKFVRVNEAYTVLNKPSSKQSYDNSLVQKQTSKGNKKENGKDIRSQYQSYDSKETFYYSWSVDDQGQWRKQFHVQNPKYYNIKRKLKRYSRGLWVVGLILWMIFGGAACIGLAYFFYTVNEEGSHFLNEGGKMYFDSSDTKRTYKSELQGGKQPMIIKTSKEMQGDETPSNPLKENNRVTRKEMAEIIALQKAEKERIGLSGSK